VLGPVVRHKRGGSSVSSTDTACARSCVIDRGSGNLKDQGRVFKVGKVVGRRAEQVDFVARIRMVNSVVPEDLWLRRKSRTFKKWSHASGDEMFRCV